MLPTAEPRDSVNGGDVKTGQDEAASGAGKGLVMRRDLLWADSLEEVLKEVDIRHEDGRVLSMVRVHISNLHVSRAGLVVIVGAILPSVLSLRTEMSKQGGTYIFWGTLAVAAIFDS